MGRNRRGQKRPRAARYSPAVLNGNHADAEPHESAARQKFKDPDARDGCRDVCRIFAPYVFVPLGAIVIIVISVLILSASSMPYDLKLAIGTGSTVFMVIGGGIKLWRRRGRRGLPPLRQTLAI
jgi:hypothetical protein